MSTTLSTVTCVPHQGPGLAARLGGDLFLVVGGSQDAQAFLLRVCSEVVARGGDGRSLVRVLAGHATNQGDEMPPCAALAPSGNSLVVFLHGEAQAEAGELFKLSGRESLAWVDRVVPWPLSSVTISLTGAGEAEEGAYNLRDGAVPGAGLTLTSVDEGSDTAPDVPIVPPSAEVVLPPEPSQVTAQPSDPGPAFRYGPALHSELESIHQPSPEPVLEHASAPKPSTGEWTPPAPLPEPRLAWDASPAAGARAPAAIDETQGADSLITDLTDHADAADELTDEHAPDARQPELHEHTDERPEVRGVYCRNDHFNDARQLICAVCAVNIIPEAAIPTSAPPPPLGALVLDDGSVFDLDEEYVIGREPGSDESVSSGRRGALVVDDDYKSVSRAHARIELHDWDVVLIDNDSANGTFVAAEGESTWRHVPPGQPHVLQAGTRILVGRRTMIYDASRAG